MDHFEPIAAAGTTVVVQAIGLLAATAVAVLLVLRFRPRPERNDVSKARAACAATCAAVGPLLIVAAFFASLSEPRSTADDLVADAAILVGIGATISSVWLHPHRRTNATAVGVAGIAFVTGATADSVRDAATSDSAYFGGANVVIGALLVFLIFGLLGNRMASRFAARQQR